jgi:hypothetical protein
MKTAQSPDASNITPFAGTESNECHVEHRLLGGIYSKGFARRNIEQDEGSAIAAAERAFWPRRSSNRRWPGREIGQQPVMLFR